MRFDAPRVEQAADEASAATREGACAPRKIKCRAKDAKAAKDFRRIFYGQIFLTGAKSIYE
jgi:hypothetical protein